MLKFQDSFGVEGLWWLPGTPEHRVPGSLTFDQGNNGKLALAGMLRPMGESMNFDPYERYTIHGITQSGKPVSLLDSFNTSRRLGIPGIGTETHHVDVAAVGLHFFDDDEAIFSKSYFSFEGIERWLGERPVRQNHTLEERKLSVTACANTRPFAALLDQTLTVTVGVHTKDASDTEIALIADVCLAAEPTEAKSLSWHLSNASKLQALASLCCGQHLPLRSLSLNGPEVKVRPGRTETSRVDVLASIMYPTGPRRLFHVPIFSAAELLTVSPQAVDCWYEQYENLDSVLYLFSTIMADKNLFVNVRFLLAVQALEAFHRTTEPSPLMEAVDHKALQEMMLAAIPPSTPKTMREKLKSTLQFTNEPSLRQRLRAIFNGIKARYGAVPGGFPVKQFIGSVVDTRNYYTHHVPELADAALDGSGMHWECRRIAALLTVLLLERIGVGASEIPEHLERHREFSQLWSTPGRAF